MHVTGSIQVPKYSLMKNRLSMLSGTCDNLKFLKVKQFTSFCILSQCQLDQAGVLRS